MIHQQLTQLVHVLLTGCGLLILAQCSDRQTTPVAAASPSAKPAISQSAISQSAKMTQPNRVVVTKPNRQARTQLKQHTQQNPEAADVNVQLGLAYLQKGDISGAQAKLQQAVRQAPSDVAALNALAYFYVKTGQIQKADHYYHLALKKNPHSGQAHNNYGVFLCQHHKSEQAIQHFMSATEDSTYLKSSEAFENAGLCALKLKQTDKAKQYLLAAHQRDPNRASVLIALARLAYQQGDFTEATTYLAGAEKVAGPNIESMRLAKQLRKHSQPKARMTEHHKHVS